MLAQVTVGLGKTKGNLRYTYWQIIYKSPGLIHGLPHVTDCYMGSDTVSSTTFVNLQFFVIQLKLLCIPFIKVDECLRIRASFFRASARLSLSEVEEECTVCLTVDFRAVLESVYD